MEGNIEKVRAEVVGELAGPQDILDFDAEAIAADLVGMQAALDRAAQKADLYEVDDDTLKAADLKDVRKWRADINETISDYDSARKGLKARLMKPYEVAEQRGKELIAPLKAIEARLKREVDTRDARERQERENHLRDVYATAAPVLMPLVPFERILEANSDKKWLLKSTKPEKAEEQLIDFIDKIAKGWETLQAATLHYPSDAEAEYFRTLDLGAAMRFDAEKFEEQQALEAVRAEVEANKAAMRGETYVAEGHDGEPVVIAETRHIEAMEEDGSASVYDVVDGVIQIPQVYLLALKCTKEQLEIIKDALREAGLKGCGHIVKRPDIEHLETALAAIRRPL